ncbi:hypothetical protein [Gordonia jinghuaiqii]|nr:hypothetical protein [Gordonia jinghuaiqii]
MTFPPEHPPGHDGPRPSPGAMPRRQHDPATDGFPGQVADLETPDVEAEVSELLSQVDAVRESVGDTFSLASLERQAVLLEQAHDALTAALDAVDRR